MSDQPTGNGAGAGTQEPPQEPPAPPREPSATSALAQPASVFERLQKAYAEASEERREIFPLLTGRFDGMLAIRVRPIDSAKRKKKVRRAMKRGVTNEAEIQYEAEVICEATEAVLVRLEEGGDWVEPHQVSNGLGDSPVRFDSRLGTVIGPKLEEQLQGGESPATILRLLFKNPEALNALFIEVDLWLKEALPSDNDDDDEDGEGAERPT